MQKVSYVNHMGDDLTVVNAARISFDKRSASLAPRDEKLIRYLADHQHMSPFEHCLLTVEIHCPLYISKQIMRHRAAAYNEVSRRYTEEDIQFYVPAKWRQQAASNRQASEGAVSVANGMVADFAVAAHHRDSLALYERLLDLGVCREQARGVLPQSMMTRFIMTANLRNWTNFVKLREHSGAQGEVQEIAGQVKALMLQYFPVSTAALLNPID